MRYEHERSLQAEDGSRTVNKISDGFGLALEGDVTLLGTQEIDAAQFMICLLDRQRAMLIEALVSQA